MKTRLMHAVPILAVTVALAGCNGPTARGLEAREDARNRIGVVSAQFTYDQARQEYEVGQFDRALRDIDAAIQVVPESARFHVLRGKIFLETHRLEHAVEAFQTALEHDPNFAEAHYFSGIVFQRWSNDDEAHEHYRAAWEIAPDQVHYLLATAEAMIALGELEGARELVESRLAYFEHNAAMRHLLGQIALLEGRPREAARLYGEARMLDPENRPLMEELAWAQYDAGLYAQCLDTVAALQGMHEDTRADLTHLEARCLAMLGRSTDAHRTYVELTHVSPANASVWIEFGTLAWKLGDYRRVAQCSVRIIDLAPHRFEGYMLQGLYERHEGRLDQAVELLDRAAQLSNETVLPCLLLGRTFEDLGDQASALATYDRAAAQDPANTDAMTLAENLRASMVVTAEEE